MREYADHDGLALGALVAKGEVTPAELVEAAIERIERRNGVLNAVVHKAYDEARRAARGAFQGPFAGVPFLIKDLGAQVAGWPRTSGSRFAAHVVDNDDSALVRKFRASGVNLIGKSNTPEYGITGTTESVLLGPCRNPWNPEHIAGGSSGGAASAVAAGIAPLAHASDGLGSIRIPAACCGLVGLKTTRERTQEYPDPDDVVVGLGVNHVVSRSVRDSAAMLDCIDAPLPDSPYAAPPKTGPFLDEVGKSPGRLRIAWSSQTPNGKPIDPEIQAALEAVADMLKHLGHDVFPRDLDVDLRALYAARAPISGAAFASGMQKRIAAFGREPAPDELEPLTWASYKGALKVSGAQAISGFQEMRTRCREVLRQFKHFDVFLTPVMGTPPPKIGYLGPDQDPRELMRRQAAVFPFTPPFNFTGQPSISLPLAWSKEGLPIGMMFTARYADEATLFRLAGQLEKEAPWAGRKPPIWN